MHLSSAIESGVSYKGPDTKQLTSARLRRSIRRGLDAVIEKWKARAEGVGDDAEAIDLAYVMNELLATAVQHELADDLTDKGELPTSESAWDEIIALIKKKSKR